jgi:hypothetical protein
LAEEERVRQELAAADAEAESIRLEEEAEAERIRLEEEAEAERIRLEEAAAIAERERQEKEDRIAAEEEAAAKAALKLAEPFYIIAGSWTWEEAANACEEKGDRIL